jgi:alkylhydroperoxidase family enzyme
VVGSPVTPLGQQERPRCSVSLADADLGLGNANWTKGLQAMSDWIWSGNLNPGPFPNNLARYFLQIPGIFEQQLYFSTTLIFDEPSFRNGVQVSGFVDRPVRELVISLIGQRRRSWYTMTHHAVLGTLTARKHGIPDKVFANKLVVLTEHRRFPDAFSPLEREVLKFADAFATNPKSWSDEDCVALKKALRDDNKQRYAANGLWMAQLDAARAAHRGATAAGDTEHADELAAAAAAKLPGDLPDPVNEQMVNAQLVELAFLALQFVALTDVFSALNVPDESFLPDFMMGVLQPEVIARLNELNRLGGEGLPPLVPPQVALPIEDLVAGRVQVAPASLKGTRVPLASYEIDQAQATRDKGVAVGAVQVGVWGWSFGAYFPGGLVYLLMHHPELARFEPPYSLPLLFNEDEWRNGTQTGGFVPRRLREIVYLKIYATTRARYGLEHHTMFLFNIFLDEYGVGRPPNPPLTDDQKITARDKALRHAENVVIYVQDTAAAPRGTYTDLELATMEWVERLITRPHTAYTVEKRLRGELDAQNKREVKAGTRRLDVSPGLGAEAAHRRLLDHQIAELAMLAGHMDGLGRAMTMLRLESEDAVTTAQKYMTDRPGLFQFYDMVGVTGKARTANELRLNPVLLDQLKSGKKTSPVSAPDAATTGEF